MNRDPAPTAAAVPARGGPLAVSDAAPGVRAVRLDRPERRNAVDAAMLAALEAALADPPPVIVLGSTDPAALCSGLDLRLDAVERARVSDGLYGLYEAMASSPAIIIAAWRGAAVGAGAQIAIASDLRVASPDAWLRFPGVGHGLAVGSWGLPSLVGRGRALRLCLTMERVPAADAHAWGLVEWLDEDPWAAALALARGIAGRDAAALARTKRVVAGAAGAREALRRERASNRASWSGSTDGLD